MNILVEGFLEMSQVNLLILDECHNAVRDPSLKCILANYEKSSNRCKQQSRHPRILGLTASVVNKKCKPVQLAQMIINLESSLHSVIQTSNSILSGLQ